MGRRAGGAVGARWVDGCVGGRHCRRQARCCNVRMPCRSVLVCYTALPSDVLRLLTPYPRPARAACRYVDGTHYSRTLEAWLVKHDQHKQQILKLFDETYPKGEAVVWFNRWRMFYLACRWVHVAATMIVGWTRGHAPAQWARALERTFLAIRSTTAVACAPESPVMAPLVTSR